MPYDLTQIRILRAPPERVWRALTNPAALAKWNPPDGFVCEVHEFDLREGGRYRMAFRNFTTDQAHAFGGTWREVVVNERLVATDRFENPNLPGEMVMTYQLRPVAMGTELTITQQGLPDVIPEAACRLGWQQSFEALARLVEPEIREG